MRIRPAGRDDAGWITALASGRHALEPPPLRERIPKRRESALPEPQRDYDPRHGTHTGPGRPARARAAPPAAVTTPGHREATSNLQEQPHMATSPRTAPAAGPEQAPAPQARGVWAAALTPVDAQLGIDEARYLAFAEHLLDEGCHGLAVFGTTGEANSFSADERMHALEYLLEHGVPAERLMVGTGTCALTDTVRLTRHAVTLGCAGVLVLPPFYYKDPGEEGLFASYREIIERVAEDRLRVYLYHFPRMSAVPITFGLIEMLLGAYPQTVAGVKDSSGDWANTSTLLSRFPQLAVLPGNEKMMLPALRAGATGCITAGANVNAAGLRAAYDAWAGDDQRADALHGRATALRTALDASPMIPGLKYLTAHGRADAAWRAVRPPLVALGDAEGEALRQRFEAARAGS